MITKEEKEKLMKHLAIYSRQKVKISLQIEECKTQMEELTTQNEQYPNNDLIKNELEITHKLLANLELNYQTTITYISGVEWLLEP